MFWTKCFKIDCHTHSEQKLWRSHIIFTSHCCKFYTHLYTTFKHWTLNGMNICCVGCPAKKHSCVKLYRLCVWQTHTMNKLNFRKEWPRCTAWSICSKNHRLLSVLTHLTTTLWCMFIEKASRPHDHVSAKKKKHLISHRNQDLVLPHKWVQLNHNGIRETILWEQQKTKPYICINICIYIYYMCIYTYIVYILCPYAKTYIVDHSIGKPIDIMSKLMKMYHNFTCKVTWNRSNSSNNI